MTPAGYYYEGGHTHPSLPPAVGVVEYPPPRARESIDIFHLTLPLFSRRNDRFDHLLQGGGLPGPPARAPGGGRAVLLRGRGGVRVRVVGVVGELGPGGAHDRQSVVRDRLRVCHARGEGVGTGELASKTERYG